MLSSDFMNGGQNVPDFYGAPGKTKLFEITEKDVITYTEDGRALIDGRPVAQRAPEQMWQLLIRQMLCARMRIRHENRGSRMRRFWGNWGGESRSAKVDDKRSQYGLKLHITTIPVGLERKP